MNENKINFLESNEQVDASFFGICDDEDDNVKTPAYVDSDATNQHLWGAVVTNETRVPVRFVAVDNNIEVRRKDGSMDNRCDALLFSDTTLIFIELKSQKHDWISHAVWNQLYTTICRFKEQHNINKFAHRKAYACNKKHPRFAYSEKHTMDQFRKKTGVRLIIARNVVV